MIKLIAVGVIKSGPEFELIGDFEKRLTRPLQIIQIDGRKYKDAEGEGAAMLDHVKPQDFLILLDERGKDLTSPEFSTLLNKNGWRVTFVIGGSYGVSGAIKARANYTLRLGALTWPHKLARVMLVEQLYRAQQIESHHPYHHA